MKTTAQQSASLLDELRAIEPVNPSIMADYFTAVTDQATRLVEALGVTKPPISDAVLQHIPGVVIERSSARTPDEERVLLKDGTFHLIVHASQDARKQRFHIAHLLRHVLIYTEEPGIDASCMGPEGIDMEELDEVLADTFARALLMPESMVRRAIKSGVNEIHALAELFDVSLDMARFRLEVLGLQVGRDLHEDYGRT